MRIISFAQQKGGAGKTTLCASMAVAAAQAGERVAVVDLDRQRSMTRWAERRAALEALGVELDVFAGEAGDVSGAAAELGGQGYTLAVLDTAGVDDPGGVDALRIAHLCIVPVQASTLDMESCLTTVERLQRLRKAHLFVLNEADATLMSARNREAFQALYATFGEAAPVFETPMVRRVAHVDAIGAGVGVTEYEPSGKAAKEIRALWSAVQEALAAASTTKGEGAADVA